MYVKLIVQWTLKARINVGIEMSKIQKPNTSAIVKSLSKIKLKDTIDTDTRKRNVTTMTQIHFRFRPLFVAISFIAK